MRFSQYSFLVFILFVPFSLSSSTWNDSAGDNSWNTPDNWDGGVPNAIGAEADFPTIGAAQIVNIAPAGITVGQIHFESTVDYTINALAPSQLNFESSSGNTLIIIDNTGTHTITAPIEHNRTLDIQNNNTVNALTLSGNISGADILIEFGKTILSGTNTYNTTFISENATLQLNAADSIPAKKVNVDGSLVLTGGIGPTIIGNLNGTGTVDLNDNTLSSQQGSFFRNDYRNGRNSQNFS